MISKTALMTGIATLMLTAAPALAQDAMAPSAQAAPPAAAAPAQPAALQLTPGSDVTGSDGAVLGKLEGARSTATGEQELTVRGADGTLRGVPLGGLRQEGAGVVVGWTATDYQAAPAITDAAPGAAPAPGAPPAGAAAPASDPMSEPMAEPETSAPTSPTEPQA